MNQLIPEFLWLLFKQLRRRSFPLGLDDFIALQNALRTGFGWSSREELRDLCCALWAKSKREQDVLKALFNQLDLPVWQLPKKENFLQSDVSQLDAEIRPASYAPESSIQDTPRLALLTEAQGGPLPTPLDDVELPKYHFIFIPQFPLTYREVAQAWRRLRQPVREGVPVELDVKATVDRRGRSGVTSEVVLVPRRRNTARLLLLIDRQGSMTPFHSFVDEVCIAIQEAGNLERVALFYFHDTLAEGADETPLKALPDQLFPTLDAVLAKVTPLSEGFIYQEPNLLSPQRLDKVLQAFALDASVVIISDGGAARGRYDLLRLLDTLAFIKALRTYTHHYVWLNPLPKSYWHNSTAAQLARYVPMFQLDQAGMYRAVNILRGHPFSTEKLI